MKKGKEMAQANYSPLRVASASAGCVVLEDERSYFALRGVIKGFHFSKRRPQKIADNPMINLSTRRRKRCKINRPQSTNSNKKVPPPIPSPSCPT